MTLTDLCSRLHGVTKTASGFSARCPAHEDKNPSLSIGTGSDGRILLHCQAGCGFPAICEALGVKPADLFPDRSRNGNGGRRTVATYPYRDEAGKLLFQVVRYDPKDFRQRSPDPATKEGWTYSTKHVRKVLFRLPEILTDIQLGHPILLAEGEKDVLALVEHGFSATCNPGGAGKWSDDYTATLTGADVIILPDADEPGRRHAELVASRLNGKAKRVRVVELPQVSNALNLPVKDAFDYFQAGGNAGELIDAIDEALDWKPQAQPEPESPRCEAGPADIRGVIVATLRGQNLSPVQQKTQIAKAVVDALRQRGRFYFHAERRDFDSAMVFDGERKRLERIRSDSFIAWLSDWLSVNRADGLFKYVLAEVETAALGSGSTPIIPEAYWASRPGAVYLSNGDGRIVRATAAGLDTVDNGTDGVLFAAGRTLAPWNLTDPADPFETCSLFTSVHCAAGHGADLLRVWLYSLPTSPRSKPPLCLAGDIGSGKTRTAKGIAELYGLPFVASKVEDEAERDFWPSVDAGGLLTLDNADSRVKWLADSLANAATDGCSQRRKLYTDAETVTLRSRAWICVTTANPLFASDAGLADRLLVVRMNRRAGETSDSKLTDEIVTNRDAALSHIVTTIQAALADDKPTPTGLNSRHPDFAAFAVKIGRALGREAETIAALQAAEMDKAAFCLENDQIGAALMAYLKEAKSFTGTAAELVPKLCEVDGELTDKLSPKRLSKRLAALWPHLEKALDVVQKQTDRKGFIVFTLALAEIAEIETAFSEKSLAKGNIGTFRKTPFESRQSRQSDCPDPDLTHAAPLESLL